MDQTHTKMDKDPEDESKPFEKIKITTANNIYPPTARWLDHDVWFWVSLFFFFFLPSQPTHNATLRHDDATHQILPTLYEEYGPVGLQKPEKVRERNCVCM